MKPINEMTRKDFESLPKRHWQENIRPFDSMVILPLRRKHDSGYRCMDFVACLGNTAICRLSGCSDVIHIEGIGGYGLNWLEKYGRYPDVVDVTSWSIDCLPKSGLLRLFTNSQMTCGDALSSFEVYQIRKPPKTLDDSEGLGD